MKRILGRFVFVLVALIATLGLIFWLRPLAVFDLLGEAQMYHIGASSDFIQVGGYRVHYYALGPADGPVAVLVHGLGGRSENWTNLAPYLTKAGYRVHLPDLPGFGRSEKPVNFSYSVTDQSKVVEGFLDALGLKQVDLGGWSMGGWIAQIVARDHPDRVRRLMLFDSAGLYFKPDWDTRLFTPGSPAELDKFYALLMPHPPNLPTFVARDTLRSSRAHAWVIHRALDSMLTGRDITDKLLSDLKMPVLIEWGAVDQITPLSLGERMHQLIPQSQIDVVPGCGHLAPSECADQMGPATVRFLRE